MDVRIQCVAEEYICVMPDFESLNDGSFNCNIYIYNRLVELIKLPENKRVFRYSRRTSAIQAERLTLDVALGICRIGSEVRTMGWDTFAVGL